MNTKTKTATTRKTSVDGAITRTQIFTEIITRRVRLADGGVRVKHKAPPRKEYRLRITQHLSDWCSNPLNDDYEYSDVIAMGNRDCRTRNVGEYAELYDRIIDRVIEGDMDDTILNFNRCGYKNVSEVIEDYLGVKPNKYQTGKVKKCLEERYGTPNSHYYDEDLIADLLTLFTPHDWESRWIHGCVQGECTYAIYPTDIYSKESIDNFEAFYFGLYWDYEAEYKGDSVWYQFCGFEDEDWVIGEIAADFGTSNIEYHSYY